MLSLERTSTTDWQYLNGNYDINPLSKEQQAKLHLEYGEKDFDLNYKAKAVPNCSQSSSLQQPDFTGIYIEGTSMSHIASKYFFAYN